MRGQAVRPVDRAVLVALLATVALVGFALRDAAVDDSFVTYRYARNLIEGRGFVYNAGEPVLSTTAPLYALLLAAGGLFWRDLPALSNVLGFAGLFAAAACVYLLLAFEGDRPAGLAATFALALSPLTPFVIGLETWPSIALALGGMTLIASGVRRPGSGEALLGPPRPALGRHELGALCLALATLMRTDLLVPSALALLYFVRGAPGVGITDRSLPVVVGLGRSRPWLRPIFVYLAVVLAGWATLVALFGSPVPLTLSAKVAQQRIGWPDYFEGLAAGLRDLGAANPVYGLGGIFVVLGLAAMFREPWSAARSGRAAGAHPHPLPAGAGIPPPRPPASGVARPSSLMRGQAAHRLGSVLRRPWSTAHPARRIPHLLLAWAALHALAYQALGVASYDWYYAPLLPAAAVLGGKGVSSLAGRLARREGWRLAAALALSAPLLVAEAGSLAAAAREAPSARIRLYRQAGEWLAANTPAGAQVGVMEVGVMGYYAGRPMIDFLGLLRPETVAALRHDDIFWTLARYQPEYVALTDVNPLWGYPLQAEPWFRETYRPLATFEDAGFWGKRVIIYRRETPAPPAFAFTPVAVAFGEALELRAYAVSPAPAVAGAYTAVALRWRAAAGRVPKDRRLGISAQLLAPGPALVAQGDVTAAPGGWGVDETVEYVHLIKVPAGTPAGAYTLFVSVYDPGDPRRRLPATGDTGGYADGAAVGVVRVD